MSKVEGLHWERPVLLYGDVEWDLVGGDRTIHAVVGWDERRGCWEELFPRYAAFTGGEEIAEVRAIIQRDLGFEPEPIPGDVVPQDGE